MCKDFDMVTLMNCHGLIKFVAQENFCQLTNMRLNIFPINEFGTLKFVTVGTIEISVLSGLNL